jgi:hypothetical protein
LIDTLHESASRFIFCRAQRSDGTGAMPKADQVAKIRTLAAHPKCPLLLLLVSADKPDMPLIVSATRHHGAGLLNIRIF